MLTWGLAGAGLCAWAVAAYGMIHPRARVFGRVLSRGPRHAPRVALTFDDGPDPEGTPAILDALGQAGVRAAFFMIGSRAARWPALVRRVAAAGHLVGNHSWDHHRWGMMGGLRYWKDQIGRTSALLADLAGSPPAYFRPPFALKSFQSCLAARACSVSQVTFSLRAFDGFDTTPERILERLLPRASSGDIIALHDGTDPHAPRSRFATRQALPALIRGLQARRLECARLDEVLAGEIGVAEETSLARG